MKGEQDDSDVAMAGYCRSLFTVPGVPMPEITRLNSQDAGFDAALEKLLDWEQTSDVTVETVVRDIINAVRARGDAALIEYTQRFDRRGVSDAAGLEIPLAECRQALARIPANQRSEARTIMRISRPLNACPITPSAPAAFSQAITTTAKAM